MSRKLASTAPRRRSGWLAAGLALAGLAGPLGAQSVHPMDDPMVTVQNNRDVPVTVYIDMLPFERELGVVAPLSTAALPLPEWVGLRQETVRLLLMPEGELPLEARALITERDPQLALMLPREDEDVDLIITDRLATVLPVEYLEETTVTVRNDRDEPADVFVQYGSFDRRLGRVAGEAEMTFRIPDFLVGRSAQLVLVPEGGSALASSDLSLEAGSHLGVLID